MSFTEGPGAAQGPSGAMVRPGRWPHGSRRTLLTALAVVVAAGAAAAQALRGPIRAAMAGDAGRVVEALAALLRAEGTALEPLAVSDREVSLLGGKVVLAVRREEDAQRDERDVHVHVGVRVAGGPAGLEACIMGTGTDRGAAVADAAQAYRARVLPVVLALAGVGAADALPFGGTEPWGVAGFRGFVGPLAWRGELRDQLAEAVQQARLFEGASLPGDRRPHLLKVVLLAKDGGWRRWLELDGQGTQVAGAPWTGVAVPPGAAMVVRYAALEKRDRVALPAVRAEALQLIAAAEGASPSSTACPLQLMPAHLSGRPFTAGFCAGGRLRDCAEECDAGSGIACYHAAVELQSSPATEPRAQALFLRGCRLGVASACTNAAAGLDHAGGAPSAACTVPTYQRTCEGAADAWGCTMLGAALIDGRGTARDPARARQVLDRACELEPGGPACAGARGLLARLGAGAAAGD
jgi:hypothetical protein